VTPLRYLTVALLLLSLGIPALSAGAEEEDFTIVPGKRIGVVVLGMTPPEVKEKAGNHDGSYTLADGTKVEYSQWKETDKITYALRVFYDLQGRVIQIAEAAPKAVTADGISIASSFEDVTSKYKNLEPFLYTAKDAYAEYYDDVKRGIAFEFTWTVALGPSSKHLRAILVHSPGKHVIPDSDERPVAPRTTTRDHYGRQHF
jgi:hypothetical protein